MPHSLVVLLRDLATHLLDEVEASDAAGGLFFGDLTARFGMNRWDPMGDAGD